MKKLIAAVAAVTAFGFVGAASAADMPAKAPVYKAPMVAPLYNWTGIYVGVNGGYGWGTTTGNLLPVAVGPSGSLNNFDINGGLFGGQIGFNYQFPTSPLVLGIEADWDWADINGSQTGASLGGTVTGSVKVKDLGTVRGRIGYAWDRILLYGTGGWAWSHRVTSTLTATAATPPTISDSHSLDGYTVGGGVEYGFTPNLSLKVEYLYAHLDTTEYFVSQGCPGGGAPTSLCSLGANVNVVRAGLNWRFTGFPF